MGKSDPSKPTSTCDAIAENIEALTQIMATDFKENCYLWLKYRC